MKQVRLFTIMLFIVSCRLFSQQGVSTEPAPPWIIYHDVSSSQGKNENLSTGIQLLLRDEQTDVARLSTYSHYATKVLNSSGLQDVSKLLFSFDPAYQQLKVHRAKIIRGTQEINLLERQKIKIIQREESLEYNLYDGRLTAMLLLEDVRIEDIVDYDYTIVGQNPIFGDKYVGSCFLQTDIRTEKLSYRLIVPKGRTIAIKPFLTTEKPTVKTTSTSNEYIWEVEQIDAIDAEPYAPVWYNPYPRVQFSEFQSWEEVATWASRLFNTSEAIAPELRRKILELDKKYPGKEELILAILRFIQEDIRYFGIEIGENSHKPASPSKVFTQRFGDCKDKTLLFCTMLHELGITAKPMLVDTELRDEVNTRHPSPLMFNHVIAMVTVDGIDYYLDPTQTHQRGYLNSYCIPFTRTGLIVDEGTTDLSIIPPSCQTFCKTEVNEYFSCPSYDSTTQLTVVTKYYGHIANSMRALYAQLSLKEAADAGNNYYSNEYRFVKTITPLSVTEDDTINNILTTNELYRIDSLWQPSQKVSRLEGSFFATTLRNMFLEIKKVDRKMPVGIFHPNNMVYNITVSLPEQRPSNNSVGIVRDSAFWFTYQFSEQKQELSIRYTYNTLRDYVPIHQVQLYSQHVTEALSHVGYSVYKFPGGISSYSPIYFVLLGLGGIAGVVVVILVLKRTSSRRKGEPDADRMAELSSETGIDGPGLSRYEGIKGWLILPAINLIISPIVLCFSFFNNFPDAFNYNSWQSITSPGSESYHPLLAPIIITETILNIGLFFFGLVTAIYFFRRMRNTRQMMIVWLIFANSLPLIDVIMVSSLGLFPNQESSISPQYISSLIVAIVLWVPYFYYSKRVLATFVYYSGEVLPQVPVMTARDITETYSGSESEGGI